MDNRHTQAALDYHDGTKHPYGRLMDPMHRYHPGREPQLFKVYKDLPPIPLPFDPAPRSTPGYTALDAIAGRKPSKEGPILDLQTIARLLHFSAGITKQIRYPEPWGVMPFRAAACTGALYHIELYLVCSDLPGLDAGVYHYDPAASALRRLRQGDLRQVLLTAAADEPSLSAAPAVLVLTDMVWRNAVKYQTREYRHAFWDSGTILANALAMAAAQGLDSKLLLGFVDEQISHLLDLDPSQELVLELLSLGEGAPPPPADAPALESIDLQFEPKTRFDRDFPAIRRVHDASSLSDVESVATWRAHPPRLEPPPPDGPLIPLDPFSDSELPSDPIEKVIRRRGSTRVFSRQPITYSQLSTILEHAQPGLNADFLASTDSALTGAYLIVNAVDGLHSGSYFYHPGRKALEQLKTGNFRDVAGYLALNQALGADAAVAIFYLADLQTILLELGNRGYRAAQLDASISAGRVYLAAYALGLGATGLTFFDDAVTEFFSPHAAGQSVMFLVTVGHPAKRS